MINRSNIFGPQLILFSYFYCWEKNPRKIGLNLNEKMQVLEIMNWIDEFFFPEGQHAD